MTIKIRSFDELSVDFEAKDALLTQVAFNEIGLGFGDISRLRRKKFPFSDYVGLYAVDENSNILSRVEVYRLQINTRKGIETVACIGGVATRPDSSRRGLARLLLEDALKRERAVGINLSLLWTRKSWVAHKLYENLGYEDVYEPPRAIRKIPSSADTHRGWRIRPCKKADVKAIEDTHQAMTKGDFGFAPRRKNWLNKITSWHTLSRGNLPAAYAKYTTSHKYIACGEILTKRSANPEKILSSLEAASHGRWLVFHGPFVRTQNAMLVSRGYLVLDNSWGVLMAAPLTSRFKGASMRHLIGGDSDRFACFDSDGF